MTNKEINRATQAHKRRLIARRAYTDIGAGKEAVKRVGTGIVGGAALGAALPLAYAAYKFPKSLPLTKVQARLQRIKNKLRRLAGKKAPIITSDQERRIFNAIFAPTGAYLGADVGGLIGARSFGNEMEKRKQASKNKLNRRIYAEDKAIQKHFKHMPFGKPMMSYSKDFLAAQERDPAFLKKLVKKYEKR